MTASVSPSQFDDSSGVDTGDNVFPASVSVSASESGNPHQANQNIKGM